ncbi:hypothetical protein L1987_31862 [Smallanthus sonchifolius]|uniref:Uncharacterized protein n=1 Tax=Smallanthus sonchifolius TaxID=185202 RepID=A0ACB9I7C7_9ASTR|nr:hypothetical protein L1987_31862 [Smallanthus sonchifolius]
MNFEHELIDSSLIPLLSQPFSCRVPPLSPPAGVNHRRNQNTIICDLRFSEVTSSTYRLNCIGHRRPNYRNRNTYLSALSFGGNSASGILVKNCGEFAW